MATNFNATLVRRAIDEEEGVELTFRVKGYSNEQIAKSIVRNTPFRVALTEVGNRRTLNQNALMWALIHEISIKLSQSDEDTYINALELAEAKFEYVACLPEAEHILTNNYRAVKLMNSFEHNGKTFNQYRVYDGSSRMNTKEMGKLLDAVIQMAVELDIPVEEGKYL